LSDENELRIIRRAYARQILAKADVADIALDNAFAAVRREDFLPPGPWPIFRPSGSYVDTPSADPVYLYTDDLVGILPTRKINNGQPSLHAKLLALAGLRPGEHVVHVGAGAGYYSAIMGELVGSHGRVTAVEFDPDLSAIAARNLANRSNVRVIQGDGSIVAFEPADVIYVNAGATRPSNNWLDRLKVSGRLMLPLTTDKGFVTDFAEIRRHGAIFRIVRAPYGFLAKWVSPVAIYPCEGMRDEISERALAAAFERGGFERVTRLFRHDDVPDQHCWVRAPGWCLAYE
jgi:protein-L-isoaspartate(D-aspartate) O-methyltransferase